MTSNIWWFTALAAGAMLTACGGGGGDGGSGGTGDSAVQAQDAPDAAASSPTTGVAGSSGGRFQPGLYAGHWEGRNNPQFSTTRDTTRLNAGGALLRFSNEGFGKVKAEGVIDVPIQGYQAHQASGERFAAGLAGDLYSDDSVVAFGTTAMLFNTMLQGSFDASSKALTLVSDKPNDYPIPTCKYCAFEVYTPATLTAQFLPVGVSMPTSFKVTVNGQRLDWTPANGVTHWMVSVIETDVAQTLQNDLDDDLGPSLFQYPGTALANDGGVLYHETEFLDKLLLPVSSRQATLPASLVSGKTYVAMVTGMHAQISTVETPTSAAFGSVLFTAP